MDHDPTAQLRKCYRHGTSLAITLPPVWARTYLFRATPYVHCTINPDQSITLLPVNVDLPALATPRLAAEPT